MGELIEPIDIQEPKYQTNTQQTHKKPIIFFNLEAECATFLYTVGL